MEEPQKVVEEPQTGACGDSVKTKNGCEDVFSGPPGGVVNIIVWKTPRIRATIFCHPAQKSQITGQLEAHDLGYNVHTRAMYRM